MQIELELGKIYSGVGYSGMTDGMTVIGELTEYIFEHQHATLEDADGKPMAVNSKTLEFVGGENKIVYVDRIYDCTTAMRSKEEKENPFGHDKETLEKFQDEGRWRDTTKPLSERLKNYKNQKTNK